MNNKNVHDVRKAMRNIHNEDILTKLQNGSKGMTFDFNGIPLMFKQPANHKDITLNPTSFSVNEHNTI